MQFEEILLMVVIGTAAGFLNVIAGGGSLLTLPILIFLGLPSSVANGTNRIAIMTQNVVAVASFRKSGFFDWKFGLLLAIPAVIGSIIGAHFAIHINDEVFNKILSAIMIFVLITLLWKPKRFNKTTSEEGEEEKTSRSIKHNIGIAIAFFFVGIYGGFIQAGVGFIIIAALRLLSRLSLVEINSLKVFVIAIYLFFSFIVYIVNDQVNWSYGISLAVGTGLGAWIGSRFALSKGEKWIHRILVVVVVLMSIKLWLT